MSYSDKNSSWSLSTSLQKASSLFQSTKKVILNQVNYFQDGKDESPASSSSSSFKSIPIPSSVQNGSQMRVSSSWKDFPISEQEARNGINDKFSLEFSNQDDFAFEDTFKSIPSNVMPVSQLSTSLASTFTPTFTIKILLCGAPSVGKTTVLEILDKRYWKYCKMMKKDPHGKRYAQNLFQSSGQGPNIGPQILTFPLESILSKKINHPSNIQYFVQIIDMPHTLFNAPYIDTLFLNEIHGAAIMFDISDPKSIYAVDQWRKKLYSRPNPLKHVLLLGHKAEKKPHILSPKDLSNYIQHSHFIKWYMSSVKWRRSVEDAIGYLITRIIKYWRKKHGFMAPGSIAVQRVNKNETDNKERIGSKVTKIDVSTQELESSSSDSYNPHIFHLGNEILEELMEQNPFPSIDNVQKSNEESVDTNKSTELKIQIVSSFCLELKSFYSVLRQRFKEYRELLEQQKKEFNNKSFSQFCLDSDHIDLLISEMRREEDSAIDKLDSIINIYKQTNEETLNLRCKKQFAQIKRQFYTGPVERWTSLWRAVRSFMFLQNNASDIRAGSQANTESKVLPVLPSCIEDLIEQLKEERLIIKSNNTYTPEKQIVSDVDSTVSMSSNGNLRLIQQTLDLSSYDIQFNTIHETYKRAINFE